MKEWLIRHANHHFSRPLAESEVVVQIESGMIKPEDEICPASGYWFSIQEVDEVRKHFGDIHLQALIPKDSEITSGTNTSTLTKLITPIRKTKKIKEVAADVVNPLAAPVGQIVRAHDPAEETLLTRRAQAMGALLCLIFFGTLGLLWWGSQ